MEQVVGFTPHPRTSRRRMNRPIASNQSKFIPQKGRILQTYSEVQELRNKRKVKARKIGLLQKIARKIQRIFS
jgi:hypothetical protein